MNDVDFADLAGLALGLWASGFGLGLLVTGFRKFMDKI